VEFEIFIHLINVAENVTDNAWYDALHVCVTEESLQIIHTQLNYVIVQDGTQTYVPPSIATSNFKYKPK